MKTSWLIENEIKTNFIVLRVEADNNIETDEESVDSHQLYEEARRQFIEERDSRPYRIIDDGPFLPSDLGKF